MQALIRQGELAESEGAKLLDKLLAVSKLPLTQTTNTDEEMIRKILENRHIPSREEMDVIIGQLDELATKLDEISQAQE